MAKSPIKNVLSIAGVDPSGGAGVLADIKSISAMGAYAAGVVAALTAQNTTAVRGVFPVPASFVREQLDTLFSDVRIDAVKIGMLGEADVVRVVADALRRFKPRWIVIDPVMVAKSGDSLVGKDTVKAIVTELIPLSHVMTPNLPEASVLLGREIKDVSQMKEAAVDLYALSNKHCAVLLKGGHLADASCSDFFYDGKEVTELSAKRIATKNTHGTGCALSSAIAAALAKTDDPIEAIREAKTFITNAIAASDELTVGSGHGPVNHFTSLWGKVG